MRWRRSCEAMISPWVRLNSVSEKRGLKEGSMVVI